MSSLTLAITDIQGSTSLWERLGPAFAPLLAEHNRILREAIASCRGREIRTEGDSFTVAFDAADDAVRFAFRVQTGLHGHPWPPECGEILVRIGLHSGSPSRETDPVTGRAWFAGPDAVVSTLVEGAAHGGQILLSGATRNEAGAALADAVLSDLGEHRFGGAEMPVRLWQALPGSLSARTFPPPRTATARLTNLPAETDRFVGRDREIQDLTSLIPTPAGRLVTLTGPGGIGKTRLARKVGAALLPNLSGGVWFVDTSEARSPADVARAVAAALGAPFSGREEPARAVASLLEFRKPLLVILDAFENAVPHAAATVGLWTRTARQTRFLITSRSLVQLSGEREFPVGPLPAPPGSHRGSHKRRGSLPDASSYDAVRLFADRAAAANPAFLLSADNAAVIGEICARLEGIPLAVELAAARTRELSPARIVGEMDAAPASQTLTGTIEWTLSRLEEWERAAFLQACVFRGGFFLEAAEEVIDLTPYPEAPLAIDAMQSLRDKSLIRTWDTPFGTRFGMFQPIREVGERMRGDTRALEERHERSMLAYAETWRARTCTRDGVEALDRLALEEENFLRIVEAGSAEAAARALEAWGEVIRVRGPFSALVGPATALLPRLSGNPLLSARLILPLSRCLYAMGDIAAADARTAEAVEAARAAAVPSLLATTLAWRARILVHRAEFAAAEPLFEEAARIARDCGDGNALTNAIGLRGIMFYSQHRLAEAKRDLEEAVALARGGGDRFALARHLVNLGVVHHSEKRSDLTLACYAEAEALFREHGNLSDLGAVMVNRSVTAWEQGDVEGSRRAVAEAEELLALVGNRQQLVTALGNDAALRALTGDSPGAYERILHAEALQRELGDPLGLVSILSNKTSLLLEDEKFAAALDSIRETEEIIHRSGVGKKLTSTLVEKAVCFAGLGRAEEAARALDEAKAAAPEGAELEAVHRVAIPAADAYISARLGKTDEACERARTALSILSALPDEDRKDVEQRITTLLNHVRAVLKP